MKLFSFFRKSSASHLVLVFFSLLFLFLLYFKSIIFSDYFFVNDGTIPDYFTVTNWNPNLFSGYPLSSDSGFQAFYPLKIIIYKILKLDFNFFIVSGYFLMACFTYTYVYYLTELKSAALVSAIIYSFSGYAFSELVHATHFMHAICWMPLILLSFEKLKKQFSLFWALAGSLAIFMSMTGGFIQLSLAMFPVLVSYALICWYSNKTIQQFFVYSATIVGGYLMSAPVIVSGFILSLFSGRAHLSWDFFCSYIVEFKQLLLFFFPYLMGGYYGIFQSPIFGNWEIVGNHGFVGFLCFLLAMIGLLKSPSHLKKLACFWFFFAFFAVIVSLGSEIPFFYNLLYNIPVVNNFRAPERYLFIFAFGISVLAGFGIQAILNGAINTKTQKNTTMIFAFLFMSLLVASMVLIYPSLIQEAQSKAIQLVQWYENPAVVIPIFWMFGDLIALWLFLNFPKNLACKAIFLTTACGELLFTAYFSYWHDGPSKEAFFHPPAYISHLRSDLNITNQRFLKMQLVSDTLSPYLFFNAPLYYNLPSAGGYAPLALIKYQNFLSITNYGAYYKQDNLNNDQAINIAGIKYLFTTIDSPSNAQWFADKKQFKLHDTIGNTVVYENMHVLPRAWFVNKLVVLPKTEMLQVVHSGKFTDQTSFNPKHTALLEHPLDINLDVDDTAIATIKKINSNKVSIITQTKKQQFLVLSDVYYPGWKVFIDNKEHKIYPTNYIFRGLLVPAGKHLVEFRYQPWYLYMSYTISGVTFCLLLCGFYWYQRKLKKTLKN